jgi:hypothetical protein
MLRRHSTRRFRQPRAAEFIEFVLLLPFLIFFTTFAIDMGRITMLQASLQDAVQQVARGGAQNGGWDFVDPTSCPGTSAECLPGSAPYSVLTTDINATPYGPNLVFKKLYSFAFTPNTADPTAPVTYGAPDCVNNTNPYIYAYAAYDAQNVFLTPGLYTMLGVVMGKAWYISASAVARADVCH